MVTDVLRTSSKFGTMTRFGTEPVKSRYGPSVVFTPALPFTATLVLPIVTPPANDTKFSVGEIFTPIIV